MDHESPLVYVVDDEAEVRHALLTLLTKQGFDCKVYETGKTFLSEAPRQASGCLVLDLMMPDIGGTELHKRLMDEGWNLPVIYLTGFGTIDRAVSAMKDGATTFLSKPVDPEALIAAINEALSQDRARRATESERHTIEQRLSNLTPRENEVAELIVQGKRTREIAEDLFISVKTVETHRDNIMKKLEAVNVAEVVRLVTTRNILMQSHTPPQSKSTA